MAKRVRWSLEQHDLRFPEPGARYDFDRMAVTSWGQDGSGVSPTKGDLPVGQRDQSMVGNGDTVSVATEILEHILGAAEGWLGVDHPVFAKQRSQPGGEELGVREPRQTRGKMQLASAEKPT